MELLIKSSNVNRVTASHSEYMVQGGTHTGPKGTPKRMFLEHCACQEMESRGGKFGWKCHGELCSSLKSGIVVYVAV